MTGCDVFLREHGTDWPADAADRLRAAMDRALMERAAAPGAGRLVGGRAWPASPPGSRRPRPSAARPAPPAAIVAGGEGRPGDFLRRAARSRCAAAPTGSSGAADGRLAILDYKTGTPPTQRDVDAGLAPQLPLEAAMAAAGAFGAGAGGARRPSWPIGT